MDDHKVAESIAEQAGAELVQLIGNIIVLYKESKENRLELP